MSPCRERYDVNLMLSILNDLEPLMDVAERTYAFWAWIWEDRDG